MFSQHSSRIVPPFLNLLFSYFQTEYATAVSDSPTSSKHERDRSHSFNQTTSGKSTADFTHYAINTRDYKLPGSTEEQLEIGTAFLRVRLLVLSCLIPVSPVFCVLLRAQSSCKSHFNSQFTPYRCARSAHRQSSL